MNRLSLLGAALTLTVGCTPNELGMVSSIRGGDLSNGIAPRAPIAELQLAECGPGEPTELAAGELLRHPYVQRVTSTSATVLWTSLGDGASVTVTTPEGAIVEEVEATVDTSAPLPEGRQYAAELTDLAPDTLYCYAVTNGTAPLVGRTGFRTAPTADDAALVRFVSFGDMGKRTSDQFAVLEQLTTVDFDFALLNGDIAYDSGTLAEFETNFFDIYGPLMRNVPFFPASGNHEYKTSDAGPFREVFALFENGGTEGHERWYSFDWGTVHVAVLDTELVGAAQARWLDEDLAASDLPWTIVIGHKPPYSSGSHGSNSDVRDLFGPIFERHGVDVTFWGHDHDYERMRPVGGVHYIVAGGGGVGTRPVGTSEFTAYSEQVSHFVYGEATATELKLWAIDATGAEFDSLILRK